jgi:hypothetical protein
MLGDKFLLVRLESWPCQLFPLVTLAEDERLILLLTETRYIWTPLRLLRVRAVSTLENILISRARVSPIISLRISNEVHPQGQRW